MSVDPQHLLTIVKRFNLMLLVYFGSYGTVHYRSDSDIDIAFLSKGPLCTDERIQLLQELIILHRKAEIDVVDLQTAEPLLRCEIAIHGRPFHEAEEGLFDRYSLFYIKQFYELRPVIRDRMQRMHQDIQDVITHD